MLKAVLEVFTAEMRGGNAEHEYRYLVILIFQTLLLEF